MNKLDDILTPWTALLLLGIYIAAFGIRRLIEAVCPELSSKTPTTVSQRVWEEFFLPTLPALLGLLFCLACPPRLFPYPSVVGASWVSRALYGLGAGWFAAWGYRFVSAVVQKRWNLSLPGNSDRPGPLGRDTDPVLVPVELAPESKEPPKKLP